jgi:integrase
VGPVKTEKSKNSIPLDDDLLDELLAWRQETPYAENSDYIFASPKMKGKQPFRMSRIMQHHIKSAASEAGIEIKGWHTLRHSYTTLLRRNNGDPKVVQGLLRHNSVKVTMDIYAELFGGSAVDFHGQRFASPGFDFVYKFQGPFFRTREGKCD